MKETSITGEAKAYSGSKGSLYLISVGSKVQKGTRSDPGIGLVFVKNKGVCSILPHILSPAHVVWTCVNDWSCKMNWKCKLCKYWDLLMQNTLLDWDPRSHLMNEIVTDRFTVFVLNIKEMRETLFLKQRNESHSVAFLVYVLLF